MERIVTRFMKDNLAIDLCKFDRAHRIVRKQTGINCPVIVKLISLESKDEDFHNAFTFDITQSSYIQRCFAEITVCIKKCENSLFNLGKRVLATK